MSEEIEKSYFNIGEVAAMFNVSVSLIRFWEKEFEELRPAKTQGGTRKYSKKDIETFGLIYALVKERGFTLEGAKEQLRNRPQTREKQELINRLKDIKGFLQELKERL